MNKHERFRAAVACEPVDRAPRTCWTHYATETLGGAEHAARHLVFQKEYDWDICKVVNDFQYPFPEGLETVAGPQDMRGWTPASMDAYMFREERIALEAIIADIGAHTPVVMTVFDPLRQVVRKAGMPSLRAIFDAPDAAKPMLDAISDTMCRYIGVLKDIGCDGIFLAVNSGMYGGTPWDADDELYAKLMRPYELAMLEAAEGMVRMIHVHGTQVSIQRHKDYPVEVMNVSDRLPNNPGLAEIREQVDCCILGGIDESNIAFMTPAQLRAQIDDAASVLEGRGQILAPGCTIPVWTPAHQIRTLASHGVES